jgi:hypothetical protein
MNAPTRARVTRICPHCKATILANADVCPSCLHHLRFNPAGAPDRARRSVCALRVEGTVQQPTDVDDWEYSMVLSIRNERGEEIDRKLVGVGAVRPGERRTFVLSVDILADAATAADAESSRPH